MEKYVFVIDKSSPRLNIVADSLQNKGFCVVEYGQKLQFDVKKPYIYVFSPAKKFSDDEENKLVSGALVIGVKKGAIKRKDLIQPDINDEKYLFFNNLITAEGALAICIDNTSTALYEQNVLIIGNGRLGRALEKVFSPLAREVSVCTFNENKLGLGGVRYLGKEFLPRAKEYDIVLNTVPKELFDGSDVKRFKEGCLYVELASVRSIGQENELQAKFTYLPAPRLPDKTAPMTAAREYEKHLFAILSSLEE